MLPLLFCFSIIPALVGIAPIVKGNDLLHFEPIIGFQHVGQSISIALIVAGSLMLILPAIIAIYWLFLAIIYNNPIVKSVFMVFLSIIIYLSVFITLIVCIVSLYNSKDLNHKLTTRWNESNETMQHNIEFTYSCCGWNELPACCNSTVIGIKCCPGSQYGQCSSNWDFYTKAGICIHNVTLLYEDINESCAGWAIGATIIAFLAILASLLALGINEKDILNYKPIPAAPAVYYHLPAPAPKKYVIMEIN